ncbi:MAG: choice-of-anchor A family protein, partial [Bacteroidota bacterium]|nr:choice-of-anchor A family protein [Bacteroidota bacterium]
DLNGNPVPNISITLSTTSGTLSTTTVTTGTTGISPVVTLTQGSVLNAVVTAIANVIIPQGTRYVHCIEPNTYQKLVLATPTQATRTVTSCMNWYNSSTNCDLLGFKTYTQGGWGSPSNSTPGGIRDAHFTTVFPQGMTIGTLKTAKFSTAVSIKNFLPQGGTASAFTTNYVNPTSTSAGVFGGQVAALAMNVYYDNAGKLGNNPLKLKDLKVVSGTFQGKTVAEILDLCNKALGGETTGFTFSQLNDAATSINENFDNGNTNNGYLTCGQNDTPNMSNWTGSLGADSAICVYTPQWITINGWVKLTPNPSKAKLQTSWRIVHPVSGDTTYNYVTVDITKDTTFQIKAWWPGVTPNDSIVEIHYGVNVLDASGNPVHAGIGKDVYWTTSVCPPPVANESDLRLLKTVDKQTVNKGDEITYSIKVTNNGPKTATGVEVKDILPAGLQFVSGIATIGSYNNNTGIWTVGTIGNGADAVLTIKAKVIAASVDTAAFNLGVASDYNLFVLYDLNQPSSDTEGKVAVGRSASLNGYSVGDKLPNSYGTQDVLVVGQNLNYGIGAVYNGNVVYGNSSNLPKYSVSVTDGTVRKDSVIDFDAARAYLQNLSLQLAAYPVNGTTTFQWGEVALTGTDPFLNVFRVDGANLSAANNFTVNVPNGSAVLVNFTGNDLKWSGGLEITGTDKANVLYNFNQTTKLKIQGIDVRGSILAPFADVYFVTGVQNGQMIAKNVTGQGQFNNTRFVGHIPKDTTIVNIAEVWKSDLHDPNSTPGNGNPTEDDYSFASVKVLGAHIGTGTPGTGSWQLVGNFNSNEMVLSMGNDANHNMLAGTLGGNIYRSADNGQNWANINSGMNTQYIWNIAVKNNTMFAATEKGVYRSVDNGNTWNVTSLASKDVRSLVIDQNGNIYAAVWGGGVYKSENMGISWSDMNNGLLNKSVHALAINSVGELFAGTFGNGVYKSTDGGNSWSELSLGAKYVWSLGVTSNNTVYAGTYGNGVYRSNDNGSSWTAMDVAAQYAYAVTVDAANNVYVSSWSGGVYATANNGNSWLTVGSPNQKISSIIINQESSTLFAGTSQGSVYQVNNALTSTKNESSTLPVKFDLGQNYPNPFNPATTINFSVPKAGLYTLKVYNSIGQEVATLISKEYAPGNYSVNFSAKNLASGMYIYRLSGNNVNMAKKMMLIK